MCASFPFGRKWHGSTHGTSTLWSRIVFALMALSCHVVLFIGGSLTANDRTAVLYCFGSNSCSLAFSSASS